MSQTQIQGSCTRAAKPPGAEGEERRRRALSLPRGTERLVSPDPRFSLLPLHCKKISKIKVWLRKGINFSRKFKYKRGCDCKALWVSVLLWVRVSEMTHEVPFTGCLGSRWARGRRRMLEWVRGTRRRSAAACVAGFVSLWLFFLPCPFPP